MKPVSKSTAKTLEKKAPSKARKTVEATPVAETRAVPAPPAKASRAATKAKSTPPPAPQKSHFQTRVAELAYAIYHEKGCPHGQDQAHWYEAETRLSTQV